MQYNAKEKKDKILARIQQFCLFDDDFMTKCFENNIQCTELVLRIIMGRSDLKVTEARTQYTIKNLQGRSIRLDIDAVDSLGKKYDIEIQRADKGAGAGRARYNSSLIDANVLSPGKSAEMLPETYVIFITENDVFGGNKPIYHVERTVAETKELFAERVRYFKEDEKGVRAMCKAVEELCREELVDAAKRMLADGILSIEKIAEYSGLTMEEVKELAEQK